MPHHIQNPEPAQSDTPVAPDEDGISLCDLERGAEAMVVGVRARTAAQDGRLVLRLIELGFVPGERLRVVAHGQPGNEPIAVRIGGTAFALRRFEADCVRVMRAPQAAA